MSMTSSDEDRLVDDAYPRRLLRTVIASVIVFSSSMTIVSASLPTMAEALDSSESLLSWGVTGLFLPVAVGTPVLGRLGDVHGHRKVFVIGACILSVGTVLCAVAPTAEAFVVARMIVGVGIAATLPNGMSLIMEQYPGPERVRAMGWFQMAMVGAPVLGLVIGGPLIEAFGWRMLFVVLTPISLFAVFAAWRGIRPSGPGRAVPIDWSGAVALAVTVLALLLFLQRGGGSGFGDPLALVLGAVAVIGLPVFLHNERRVDSPLLPLHYLRRPNFRGPLIAQSLGQFAYMGSFLIAPLLLDVQFGFSVSAISFVLLVRPAVFSSMSPIGGRLAMAVGERAVILTGAVLMVAAMVVWVPASLMVSLPLVFLALVLAGTAMGLASPAYLTTVASSVEPEDLGVANGMGSMMMEVGTITGIQAMFTVLGDGRSPEDFATVFGFGGVVGAVGIVGALMVRDVGQVR